ncbi:unnamed protein product [Aphanomyces euteiches]|uniref:Uncharacterized protein n=1 Tax=Aphanomyces euteiches TaxID=100861 RepID=A0A6G0XAG5_9STRA|nr:hypothetical protein Ae201684_006919 [Aphanomyces euteiches]KAH9087305.1 hypothetical protein Ae201684P_000716 [Aphanomyces euteiches]KAH9132105.1 hypothetical protein AeRB84_021372 [Aphanomyces euteiches]
MTGEDDAQTTLLLRMRVQGACIGYCLLTGEFLFATKGSTKFFGSTDDASALYGDSLLAFLSPLDTQRLQQYLTDVQTQLHYIECHGGTHDKLDIMPILASVGPEPTTIVLEVVSTPLTLRLQRCIDAVQTMDITRRFSDESTFIIDDDDYRSVIANDALQVTMNEDSGDSRLPMPTHVVERDGEESLSDFAFDFQADWDRAVVELDELTTEFEYDPLKVFGHGGTKTNSNTQSPVAASQV